LFLPDSTGGWLLLTAKTSLLLLHGKVFLLVYLSVCGLPMGDSVVIIIGFSAGILRLNCLFGTTLGVTFATNNQGRTASLLQSFLCDGDSFAVFHSYFVVYELQALFRANDLMVSRSVWWLV